MIFQRMLDFYGKHIQSHTPKFCRKVLCVIWGLMGYKGILLIRTLTLDDKITLIKRFLQIDLNVEHAHWPGEITYICKAMFERPAKKGEVMVEAGCWNGGSSSKFSIICKMLGYKLYVYDSFQGVESSDQEGWDFAGEYQADQKKVESNIAKYGEIDVCSFFPGWFSDTLARNPVPVPVRAAYIDCDLASGTLQALQGVMPNLTDDAILWSQDYHVKAVREVINDPATWRNFKFCLSKVEFLCYCLARLHLDKNDSLK